MKKTKLLGFTLREISSERVAGKVRDGVNNLEREREREREVESELWRNGMWGKKPKIGNRFEFCVFRVRERVNPFGCNCKIRPIFLAQ